MSVLSTTAKFKAAYGIGGTSKDTQIGLLLDQAEQWIENFTGRVLPQTTHIELFSPGRKRDAHRIVNGNSLIAKEFPIISVTSLHEDSDRTFDASALIAASEYWNDDFRVTLYDNKTVIYFTAGERTVQLIYVAGYASGSIPADLEAACNMLAYHLYKMGDKQQQNIISRSIGGETVQYANLAMPLEVMDILKGYKRTSGLY